MILDLFLKTQDIFSGTVLSHTTLIPHAKCKIFLNLKNKKYHISSPSKLCDPLISYF